MILLSCLCLSLVAAFKVLSFTANALLHIFRGKIVIIIFLRMTFNKIFLKLIRYFGEIVIMVSYRLINRTLRCLIGMGQIKWWQVKLGNNFTCVLSKFLTGRWILTKRNVKVFLNFTSIIWILFNIIIRNKLSTALTAVFNWWNYGENILSLVCCSLIQAFS